MAHEQDVERALRETFRELRHDETDLRLGEPQLRTMSDALPALVAYVDADQRYRFVNDYYEHWFGFSKASLIGAKVEDSVGGAAYALMKEHVATALGGTTTSYEALLPYRIGKTRFVRATYVPDVAEDGTIRGFTSLVTDISEEKRLEASRESALERSDRLMQITAAIADAVTREEVFEAVVDRAAIALGASIAGLWLLDEDRSVRLARGFGYPAASMESLVHVPLDTSPSFPVLDSIRSGQPTWLGSPGELRERYPHLAAPPHPQTLALLPLGVQGHARGSLVFTFDHRESLDADERQLLMLVARYASQAVERLSLLDAERRSRAQSESAAQRLAVLSRASRVLADSRSDLADVLRAVTDEVVPECADSCAIGLQADGEAFSVVACVHRDPDLTEPLRELLSKTNFAQETMFRVGMTGEELFLREHDFAEFIAKAQPAVGQWFAAHPPGSLYVVPLRAGGNVIGTLASFREKGRPRFSEGDRLLLTELSERAAVACERTRLHRENEQSRLRVSRGRVGSPATIRRRSCP